MLTVELTLSLLKDLRLCLLAQNDLHADTTAHRLERDLIFSYRKHHAVHDPQNSKFNAVYMSIGVAKRHWKIEQWDEAIQAIDEAIAVLDQPSDTPADL